MTTNVPTLQFTNTGLTIPTDNAILAGVQIDQNTAFNTTLNPSLSTPQGQLATTLSAIISDKNGQIASVMNNLDPNFSSGRWQDALGKIYGITRLQGAGTVVNATVSGTPNTIIPTGTKAQDSNGNIYSLLATVTIGNTGSSAASFQNDVAGSIACPVGALNTIYQAVSGWNAINNTTAGVLGRLTETRAEFETRRKNSLSLNASGTNSAIRANLLALPNVLSAYVIDNPANTTTVIGGVSIPPNTLFCAVQGGVATDIAQIIWEKNAAGTPTMGSTTIGISDTTYPIPYPVYNISYSVPVNVPIFFNVVLRANTNLPTNINTLVQDAIITEFTGTDPEVIGRTVYSSKYSSVVNAIDVSTDVTSISVGTSAPGAVSFVDINIDQFPTISAANITVTQA